MKSKFWYAQKMLADWRLIIYDNESTLLERRYFRADLIKRAKKLGFGSMEFGQWLNRATLSKLSFEFNYRWILNETYRQRYEEKQKRKKMAAIEQDSRAGIGISIREEGTRNINVQTGQ